VGLAAPVGAEATVTGEMTRLHARLGGRVQGVGFRYFVRESAKQLGVLGWVRNLADGRVELIAEADREDLELLVEQLRKGPPGSKVSDVDLQWMAASGEFADFAIVRNA
jgi:acylphosphatase